MSRRDPRLLLGLAIFAACGREPAPAVLEPPPPGLAAEPRWLAFACDASTCADVQVVRVSVVGRRPIAVKRIALEGPARGAFEIASSRPPPFVLAPAETLEITASRRPDSAEGGDASIRLTFADASASELDPNRVAAGVLEVPLVARVVGEAVLRVGPDTLDFGAVAPGMSRTLGLELTAEGSGNARVEVSGIESDDPSVTSDTPSAPRLAVGERLRVPVVYAPLDERFVSGRLEIFAENAPEPLDVHFRGTSVRGPRLVVPAPEGLELGALPRGVRVDRAVDLENHGGEPLRLERVAVVDLGVQATVDLTGAGTSTPAVLLAMGSARIELHLETVEPGDVAAALSITSSDPATPELRLPIRGLVTEPRLAVSPLGLDFGLLPRGWSVKRTLELSNAGYGPLTLQRVELALGSSALFTAKLTQPAPIRLEREQRVGIEVEFRADAEAEFRGTIAVSSDDPNLPFFEIPLRGRGASCDTGCPIAHGSPSCAEGTCAVGACEGGWFDVDRDPASGCECSDADDPPAFCAEARRLGDLSDDGTSAVVQGVLPSADDVDVVRFFADDTDLDVFSDDYDVRIRLESDDPAIRLCISRRESDDPSSECVFEEEVCPEDRAYHRGGGILSDQSADYVVKIYRTAAEATCSGYSLFMSNG